MTLDDVLARLEGVRPCAGGYVARCPAHGDRNASLSVCEVDGRLLIKCFTGCSFGSIIAELRNGTRCQADAPRTYDRRPALDDAKRRELALSIWDESSAAVGTPVETYLRSRGITIPPPPSLRFHSSLKHPTGVLAVAMVALVQDADGTNSAIHRTYLQPDGSGKADVEPQKMMLGPCAGAAVRFGQPASTIAIAEGIETALSIAQACPELSVWAALSTSGMRALQLPDVVREVILAPDNDAPGEKAAQAAAWRFTAECRRVRIARPEGAADFNELLKPKNNWT